MLTKGVYGHEFGNKRGPFGLLCGQMRNDDYFHNAGWFNKFGEKLGWGDLSPQDVVKIHEEIPEDEMFIVLSERDSFWNFVKEIGIIGSMCKVEPTVDAPGVLYVALHAMMIITKEKIYHSYFFSDEDREYLNKRTGLTEKEIPRQKVFELLGVSKLYEEAKCL